MDYIEKEIIHVYKLCICNHHDFKHEDNTKDVINFILKSKYTYSGNCELCNCEKYTYSGKAQISRNIGDKQISFEIEDWKE